MGTRYSNQGQQNRGEWHDPGMSGGTGSRGGQSSQSSRSGGTGSYGGRGGHSNQSRPGGRSASGGSRSHGGYGGYGGHGGQGGYGGYGAPGGPGGQGGPGGPGSYGSDIKLSNNKKNKTGLAVTIISGLMMLYGAGGMMEEGKDLIVGAVIFDAGFVLMMAGTIIPSLSARSTRRKLSKKQLRYSAVIGQYRRTPIKLLAEELKTNEKNVMLELQEMIYDGYLKGAYVDQNADELVVPGNSMVREKISRCPRCSAEMKEFFNYCPVCGHAIDAEADSELDQELESVRMYLGMVSSVKLYSANDELIKCAEYFGELVSGIVKRVEDKPELLGSRDIRNLFHLYLPKIAGAMENYKDVTERKTPAEKRLALEDDLCQVFYKENMALVEITNKLTDDDILDISAEIDAIEDKLLRDGYSAKQEV